MATNTFCDTRGKSSGESSFTEVILKGIAEGGGLFVPNYIPHLELDEILSLANLSYAERAAFIYKRFNLNLSDETIDEIAANAYGENFDCKEIAPISTVTDDMHVLELWHGPTSAFKDMALQCMPLFFSASVEAEETGHEYLILVATSGDTGKAAIEGFKDRKHTSIIVFFPDGGVSDIQRKQMVTQRGNNVRVYGANGNFDDCQTSVKAAFNDAEFNKKLLDEHNILLSSANSINWGRLMPQIVYYVSSYACLVHDGKIKAGSPMDVCVPTGNFGNILGAYYAREMGVPIERLVCASNENRILTDFINTGTYDISEREFFLTPSPSMDILVSSNLERQLFELTGRDAEKIAGWMQDLKEKKCFRVDKDTFERIRELYVADSASNEDCFATIKRINEEYGYLLDPHTAVAWTVAERCKSENPMLIVSTAHWAKFGSSIAKAILDEDTLESDMIQNADGIALNEFLCGYEESMHGSDNSWCYIPKGLAELNEIPVRFNDVVEGSTSGVEGAVLNFLS